jgi:hypothetical protein
MADKKQHIIPPKKSDKKKLEASNSKTKSTYSKQTIRKKRNEFGDDDYL